ncbi:S-layer homology domain-containing protein [Paenibacillus sp. strain BS8-2]
MLKRWTTLLVAFVLLMSVGTAAYAAEENDRKTYGELLFDLGLINGSNSGLDEDKELTREQMIAIVNRLSVRAGDSAFTPPAAPSFTDVPKTKWSYADIEKAYANGVTSGIGQGKFGVDHKVTYQQAVTFMARVAGYDIDYANAVEEGYELGITLWSSEKPATENMTRGDVFELIVQTLWISVGEAAEGEEAEEEEETFLINLIPTLSEEKVSAFLDYDYMNVYNPTAQEFVFDVIPNLYKGTDEHLAKASGLQHEHSQAVSEVIKLFKGYSEEVNFDAFFGLAAAGKKSIALPYEWSVYEDSEEWGEYGIYGITHAKLTADGMVSGVVETTEGNDLLEASGYGVWQYDPIVVDGKKVTPYYMLMEQTLFDGQYEFFEVFLLLDDKGVYKAALVGSYGPGLYTRN